MFAIKEKDKYINRGRIYANTYNKQSSFGRFKEQGTARIRIGHVQYTPWLKYLTSSLKQW